MVELGKYICLKFTNTFVYLLMEFNLYSRLIKGSGEVIERIVSKEEHKRINRQATMGDSLTYQKKWMKYAR